MKPKSHRGLGNRNSAKAPDKRRVTLSLRVLPETRERLKNASEASSLGRTIDELAAGLASKTVCRMVECRLSDGRTIRIPTHSMREHRAAIRKLSKDNPGSVITSWTAEC